MRIIIVGCGKVGRTLIAVLSKEDHDIIIIDKNAAKIKELKEQYKKELAEQLDTFFKERPLIKYISLHRHYNFDSNDHILLSRKEASLKLISNIEFIEESRFDALKLKAEHLYDITK